MVIRGRYRDARSVAGVHDQLFLVRLGEVIPNIYEFSGALNCGTMKQKSLVGGKLIRSLDSDHCGPSRLSRDSSVCSMV